MAVIVQSPCIVLLAMRRLVHLSRLWRRPLRLRKVRAGRRLRRNPNDFSPSRRSHSNRPAVWTPDRRGSSPRSYTSSSPGFRLSVWLRPRLYAPRLSRHHSQVAVLIISMIQMCHLNWNITWAVALDVTNINFLIAHSATIYENIISLHVSLTYGTVCQTVLWMSAL